MKEIKLENSDKKVIIDDEDYETISKTKWRFDSDGYARGGQSVRMHRLITNAPKGTEVDHINNDKLDNRKTNLRICSRQQNQWNKKPQKNNTTGYKGVTWNKKDKRFISFITYNNKVLYIGSFEDAIEAAKAYDKMAKKLYGNYAWLNF